MLADTTLIIEALIERPLLIILLAILVVGLVRWLSPVNQGTHARKIRSAKKALSVLHKITHPGQQIAYLRKIDPFVFEELILLALKRQGHKVKHNARYTGDGGIDGQVWIKGVHHLIQAKRYSNAINPGHVLAFSEMVGKTKNQKGLFIHTGRTGPKSKVNASLDIKIISGSKLLELLVIK